MKVSLARALQVKKRIKEDISKTSSIIQSENQIIEGNKRNYDIRLMLEKRRSLVKKLTDLKLKIEESGFPIRRAIFDLDELKSESSFLQSITTDEGKIYNRFGLAQAAVVEVHVVVINKLEVADSVKKIEQQIDELQYNVIDKHNNSTFIDIED